MCRSMMPSTSYPRTATFCASSFPPKRAVPCKALHSSSTTPFVTPSHDQPMQQPSVQDLQQQQQQRSIYIQSSRAPARIPAAAVAAGSVALLTAAAAAHPDAAQAAEAAVTAAAGAFSIHAEPSNALSLPTWAIHVSSVTEWVAAMALFWKYAEVTGNPRWKGMTFGMMPSLGSAMAACTWHFFYNSPGDWCWWCLGGGDEGRECL